MSNFLDTKTLYPAHSLTKEFWERFKNHYKVYEAPKKPTKPPSISSKTSNSAYSTQQEYGDFRIVSEEQAKSADQQDKLMQINLEQIQSWSPDNLELYKKLMELGYLPEIINKNNLLKFYRSLKFEDMKIEVIDRETTGFTNLEILVLSRNAIQTLENLPPNIKEVYAFYNQIAYIQAPKPYENLLYLGLGYNRLTDICFENISNHFPKLMSLDLSYNDICSLDTAISALTKFKFLKMVNFFGNPVVLIPHYRASMLEELKMLKVLDNEKVNQEVSYKLQAKQGQPLISSVVTKEVGKEAPKDLKGGETLRSSTLMKNEDLPDFVYRSSVLENIPEGIQLKLTVNICTLENVPGLNFNDQYNLSGEAPSENYQSSYWISCQILDTLYETRKQKVLFDSATVENEIARIDLAGTINLELSVSPDTRDFFIDGLLIKIWRKEPVLEETEPDAEKKPLIKENEVQLEEKVLGICKVDLRGFLEPRSDSKQSLAQKLRLWPENYVEIPDFVYPAQDESYRVKKVLEKIVKTEEVKEPEPIAIDPKKAGKGGKDAKKETKKETKKDTKKDTKKGGKGKIEPVEKKIVPLLDWPMNSREKVWIEEGDKVLDCIPNYLLAVKVDLSL